MEVLQEAYWQRCYVHFLRNALDYLHRKGGDDWCRAKPSVSSGPNHKAPTLLPKRHSSPQTP